MSKYQINLNYRFGTDYGLDDWNRLVDLVIDQVGFDDSTPFELVLEMNNQERRVIEVSHEHMYRQITPERWMAIHQLLVTNHWIKGMNVKIHLVKRHDHAALSINIDIDEAERRSMIVEKIEAMVNARQQDVAADGLSVQEREALFGTMLLTESIAQAAKKHFLSGDLKGCLQAAINVLVKRLEEKTGVTREKYYEAITLLTQDTPYLLLPDLSGHRLKAEMEGLAHLVTGCLASLQPLLAVNDKTFKEPARILKYLVVISMITERLESTIKNPAYGIKKAGPAVVIPKPVAKKIAKKPAVKDKVVKKTTKKKTAKAVVSKKVTKAVKKKIKKAAAKPTAKKTVKKAGKKPVKTGLKKAVKKTKTVKAKSKPVKKKR